ncbi:uncharacterized protein PHACADRAFT_85734 [Phanerochaete carnosa HHB-10118-sp]|uniref:EF-hand domain-containing protein n=1 Tax=Phanerochaete carnosa (strain HHB-10118-sp) TaxID=650164 RepID=K5W5M4_PHACS|nr:uncharacterized protein PHACADRAFT_85734 [Phanerochaete carnosa HHB-10118-sp]EKM59223.1 hypothetical protein PHACADRAFT_85734 [Phanerochaete carnosa HHB-10118-sp]
MASTPSRGQGPSRREIFEASFTGAQDRPWIPRLRSDPSAYHPVPHNLCEFRELEGKEARERRLRRLWSTLPKNRGINHDESEDEAIARQYAVEDDRSLTPDSAKRLQEMYHDEFFHRLRGESFLHRTIGWKEFLKYADAKEAELWRIFHNDLDLDGNGRLDVDELASALQKAGITLEPTTLTEFMTTLCSSPHSHAISFQEFRDFLLLMPRKASTAEIFRYYKVKKFMGDDGRGAARVNMEGDVTLSAEDMSTGSKRHQSLSSRQTEAPPTPVDFEADDLEEDPTVDEDEFYHEEEDDEHHYWLHIPTAAKFLLAGGVAGAVSRTCTAPFDRLKIFLITRPLDLGGASLSPQAPVRGLQAIGGAVRRIYAEGGVRGFWTGNGLSVVKILPESAIKFFAYESSKRLFAKYVDKVDDSRNISGVSRFLSGGIGGLSSQLSIYPIETMKTQLMSNTGERRILREAAKQLYQLGGVRAFYRGLTIGLVGVFPYSAIDMSTFEALKLAYLRSTGKEEPGVLVLLMCGSVSGSIGATSVYPLNLVRTRLQASGSPGHPHRYTGIMDVVQQTYSRDGWRGFYRGLVPTLAKVVPAVSISYVVYESSKRK